ncbi:hypothetical protein DL98DRAFT_520539 [Cadophora sp. DSE1049]|nr:hypothetical protein DL98DRAFT_520539 [Cadophora sp. DSE1049]
MEPMPKLQDMSRSERLRIQSSTYTKHLDSTNRVNANQKPTPCLPSKMNSYSTNFHPQLLPRKMRTSKAFSTN